MSSKKDLKILVLGYHDHTAEGHTLSIYKGLKDYGYNVCHVSLIGGYNKLLRDSNVKYFYKFSKWNASYNLFRVKRHLYPLLKGKSLKSQYCYLNEAGFFEKSAKSIIEKAGFIPNVVILGWIDFFISPKTIYDLYFLTNAKFVITMVDAHILGGGCHFPCECEQYQNGCLNCPAITNKSLVRSLYKEKTIYLTEIPFVIVGSNYDLKRAKKVPFLQNSDYIPILLKPQKPFILEKNKARKKIGIPSDYFVIMCGATSVTNIRKGFKYIIESINQFCLKHLSKRKVVLIAAGHGDISSYKINNGISIISPGYLDINMLYTFFYSSDIFISASLDDSGPVMINYSVSCGIPVVSFPTGVACDLVIPQKTGFIAEIGDATGLAEGINLFYNMSKDEWKRYSMNCKLLMQTENGMDKEWYVNLIEKM